MTTLSRRPRTLPFASLFLLTVTPLAFAPGCFIVTSPDGTGGAGGDTTSSTQSSQSTSTGQGGSSSSASTTTSSSAGVGGTGGGNMCVGETGTGQTAKSCNLMEITPSKCNGPASSTCDSTGGTGGTDDPPGFAVCVYGFKIFTAGSAENLRACLGQINGAPATACDFAFVNDCITRMYNEACSSQLAADSCQLIKDTQCLMGEPFDVAKCAEDMKPFSADGMQSVASCISTTPTTTDCVTAYQNCLDQTLLAPPVMTCP